MKSITTVASALAVGLLFGAGLAVSGMTNPAKILAFLDIAAIADGAWDATLLFVMGGALAVTYLGYRYVLARPRPVLDSVFHLPTVRDIDLRLILGAAVFGLGWGLVGYCPGPAIAALAWPTAEPALFVAAMLVGFWIGGKALR
jgi:uncharacterized membrane protein YedE/YeeE